MMLPCSFSECEYETAFPDDPAFPGLLDAAKAHIEHQAACHPAELRALIDEEIGAQLIQATLMPRLDGEATDEP